MATALEGEGRNSVPDWGKQRVSFEESKLSLEPTESLISRLREFLSSELKQPRLAFDQARSSSAFFKNE
jgi:hypothetical protein